MIGRAIALNPGCRNLPRQPGRGLSGTGPSRPARWIAAGWPCDFSQTIPRRPTTWAWPCLARGQTGEAVAQFRAGHSAPARLRHGLQQPGQCPPPPGRQGPGPRPLPPRPCELDPNLVEAHSNLGQLLLEHYQRPEALVHCREAVRLRPDFPEAQNNLGNVLRELGRLEEAKACYAEALRLNPDLAMTYNNMGQALQEEGQLDEALAWYRRALSATRTRPASRATWPALLEELRSSTTRPIARYELALRLDPDHAEAYSGLGWVRHEQGQFAEAMAHYRRALRAPARPGRGLLQPGHSAGGAQRFRGGRALPSAKRCGSTRATPAPWPSSRPCCAASCPRRTWPPCGRWWPTRILSVAKRSALHFGLALVLDAQERLRRGRRAPAAGQRPAPGRLAEARQGSTTRRTMTRFVAGLIGDLHAGSSSSGCAASGWRRSGRSSSSACPAPAPR